MLGSAKLVAFVPTRDPARARAFYQRVLGLRLVGEDAFALVFDCGGTMLRVVNVAGVPGFEPAPFTILGWDVADAHAAVRELRERGAEPLRYGGMEQDELGVWTSPAGARIAWFHDPDGNVLSITQF
ncbi:VOC family protein [Longimicrobium sp.]|uniref:VOC family protein n=1 Tax=Longimicrobium sp. TaxID=2029185 RepID=UPI002CD63C89|nr:VOC family protein [Longimicrobium sp.]HSU17468.1 VOC family protein [Longimicrobium sp.]